LKSCSTIQLCRIFFFVSFPLNEVNKALLSADNTAQKGYRLDFAGGVINDQFFMKNCGFFDGTDAIGSQFIRPIGNKKPNIDFQRLS